jgi:hypothetical protein
VVDDSSKFYADVETGICHRIFAENPEVDYVLWVFPNKARVTDSMERLFKPLDLVGRHPITADVDPLENHSVQVLHRTDFLPRLSVRQARVEDNDDLLPILEANNPTLTEGQEDFFLADLIASQGENVATYCFCINVTLCCMATDDRNRFFVGVTNSDRNVAGYPNANACNTIVGMLATSLDVNVGLITKIYDIEAFPDIIVQKQERPLPYPDLISVVGDLRIARKADIYQIGSRLNCAVFDAEKCLPPVDIANSDETSAVAAIQALKDIIAEELSKPERSGPNVPLACIVIGFPRCDEEATAISQNDFLFDCYLELGNGPESIDLEEDDQYLQYHIDAVETLMQLIEDFSGESTSEAAVAPRWKKAPCDAGDPYRCLLDELTHLVGLKAQEIEQLKIRDLEEPPKANAFAITVFAMLEEYESRAEDMLTIAFEENIEFDYCVFILPCNARPSRLTQSMVMAPVRVGVSFDQCLYILHREVLVSRDSISVSRALESMLPSLSTFLGPLVEREKDDVTTSLRASFRENDVDLRDNPAEVSFAATMRGEVIAVVSLSRRLVTNDEVNWLRANYRVEDYVAFERHRLRSQAYVTHWVGDPLLSPQWARFILREIMRLYRKTLLYYLADYKTPTCREIADVMIPVSPLCRMQPFRNDLSSIPYIARPNSAPLSVEAPLFCVAKNMLSKRKAIIATRVVIVGGNASVFPLLEYLILNPHVYLTSVQLVIEEPHNALDNNRLESNFRLGNPTTLNSLSTSSSEVVTGLSKGSSIRGPALELKEGSSTNLMKESSQEPSPAPAKSDNPVGSNGRYNLNTHVFEGMETFGCLSYKEADIPMNRELLAMGLAHRVTIVKGRLTDIDRDNRAIVISDEIVLEYDLLVLAAGVQGKKADCFIMQRS